MAGWVTKIVNRVRKLAEADKVKFTTKARIEAAELELAEDDVIDVMKELSADDSAGRLLSEDSLEWMYVFKPEVAGLVIYLKLILRDQCVVVSFHEDQNEI